MEEAGILEKITRSGFCYPALNQVGLPMTTKKKKITNSDIIGQQGIALIHQRVSGMGFLWHPTGLEAGIDGFVEVRDDQSGEMSGPVFAVQSKATNTSRFSTETSTNFAYLCEESDLDYWLNCNIPVVIIVSRPAKDEA